MRTSLTVGRIIASKIDEYIKTRVLLIREAKIFLLCVIINSQFHDRWRLLNFYLILEKLGFLRIEDPKTSEGRIIKRSDI